MLANIIRNRKKTAASGLPVTGAALWLDASQQNTLFTDAGITPVASSGQSVYQWNDLSGNNRHAIQTASGNRPTWLSPASGLNGLGAVSFNGSNQWLDIASFPSLSTGYTMLIVFKASSLARTIFSTVGAGTSNSPAVAHCNGSGSAGVSQWGSAVVAAATGGNYVSMLIKYNGSHTTGSFLVRTSQSTSDSTGTMTQLTGTPAAGTSAVGRATNATQYYDNPIFEVVIYPRQLTTTEDSVLKSYVTSKWAVAWS